MRIPGIDRVGDRRARRSWTGTTPGSCADVGRSADRFGHPYSPLQPGEIDQGQFDRVLEVLCVSSCAMLISRDAWQRAGGFDERHPGRAPGPRSLLARPPRGLPRADDAAGARATPSRRARRRAVRTGRHSARSMEDRAAITAVLKNYSFLNLLWVLPLSLALGVVRLIFLLLGRRFEEAFDLAAAWGWNVAHLPGTLARRRRVQKARRVKDRKLRRVHGVGRSAAPAMVPDGGADLGRTAGDRGRRGSAGDPAACGIARRPSWARTRSSSGRSSDSSWWRSRSVAC